MDETAIYVLIYLELAKNYFCHIKKMEKKYQTSIAILEFDN